MSTIQGWPAICANVGTWEAAALAADGELIVVDASMSAPPARESLAALTSWHSVPDVSVFQARKLGFDLARGPIVAITEDHCRVPTDWAVRICAVFAANPHISAVGGSVENGATSSALDWASYFVVQASVIPPMPSGPVTRLAGAVNVAYRREALAGLDDFDGLGAMDGLHQRRLRQAGATLLADDSIRVVHDQSLGFRRMSIIHFDAGRTYAGFLRRRMDAQASLRLAGVLVMPFARLIRAATIAKSRGHLPRLRRVWPAMLWLLFCQAAGHVAGFALGPGDSPMRLQ